jgi:ankyrin repeat protein
LIQISFFQTNRKGESALHLAASRGLARLIRKLIENGANPNLQTTSSNF